MNERLERHPFLRSIILALCVVLYFFIGAEPLASEYSIKPIWRKALDRVINPESKNEVKGFITGDWFGFISSDGQLGYTDKSQGGTVISDWAFVTKPPELPPANPPELRSSQGEPLGFLGLGSPFFSRDRLFSAALDGTTVLTYDTYGKPSWSYSFPSQISAFATNKEIVIGGTVDGWIEAINDRGERIVRFAPGGSRLPIILGVDISESSSLIAILSGLDSQRLVVLGRGKDEYRVVSHRYLESSYREPVRIAVLGDNRHVLYRQPEGIGVWEISGKTDDILPVKADDFELYYNPEQGLAYITATYAGNNELVVFRPPAKLLGRVDLGENTSVFRIDGVTAYLASAEAIGRLDFIKE